MVATDPMRDYGFKFLSARRELSVNIVDYYNRGSLVIVFLVIYFTVLLDNTPLCYLHLPCNPHLRLMKKYKHHNRHFYNWVAVRGK